MKQRTKSDCGIVAVAKLAGKPYKTVKGVFGRCHGMQTHELEWLLSEFCQYKRLRPRKQEFATWLERNKKGRFLVTVTSFLSSHAIAVIDGEVVNGDGYEDWEVESAWRILCEK